MVSEGREACSICDQLEDRESGFQKGGRPEDDVHLPAMASELEKVHDYGGGGSRELHLLRCGQCGTHYLYRTDYEFLAGGSEDEQLLIRLSPEEVPRYRKARRSEVLAWLRD